MPIWEWTTWLINLHYNIRKDLRKHQIETVILYLQIGMECHIFFMSTFRVIFLPWNKLLILSEPMVEYQILCHPETSLKTSISINTKVQLTKQSFISKALHAVCSLCKCSWSKFLDLSFKNLVNDCKREGVRKDG